MKSPLGHVAARQPARQARTPPIFGLPDKSRPQRIHSGSISVVLVILQNSVNQLDVHFEDSGNLFGRHLLGRQSLDRMSNSFLSPFLFCLLVDASLANVMYL